MLRFISRADRHGLRWPGEVPGSCAVPLGYGKRLAPWLMIAVRCAAVSQLSTAVGRPFTPRSTGRVTCRFGRASPPPLSRVDSVVSSPYYEVLGAWGVHQQLDPWLAAPRVF